MIISYTSKKRDHDEAFIETHTEKLLLEIADNSGNGTQELVSSQMLEDSDVELVADAIKRNKKIKSVYVKNLLITPRAADILFYTMLAPACSVERIRFPIYHNVMSNGQRVLMELEEAFPERVKYYNNAEKRNRASYNAFVELNNQTLAVKCGNEILCIQFSESFLLQQIKPFVVSQVERKKFKLRAKA